MVAGTSGATPGSGAADGEDGDRLKLLQAPRKIVSAATTPRLAIVRAIGELSMLSPEQIPGRSRPAANRKNAVGAMTSRKLRRCSDLVSEASYIGLTKALTTFA
jgi:hypothetical protein